MNRGFKDLRVVVAVSVLAMVGLVATDLYPRWKPSPQSKVTEDTPWIQLSNGVYRVPDVAFGKTDPGDCILENTDKPFGTIEHYNDEVYTGTTWMRMDYERAYYDLKYNYVDRLGPLIHGQDPDVPPKEEVFDDLCKAEWYASQVRLRWPMTWLKSRTEKGKTVWAVTGGL